jgi:hypothetical protein
LRRWPFRTLNYVQDGGFEDLLVPQNTVRRIVEEGIEKRKARGEMGRKDVLKRAPFPVPSLIDSERK